MQQPFKDILTALRAGRHQPYCSCSSCEMYQAERWEKACNIVTWIMVVLAFGMVLLFCGVARAENTGNAGKIAGYSIDSWADAIKHAENSKNHPYGIMVKYKHTSPRNACKNTVSHNWRNYAKLPVKTRQAMPFVTWLGRHYAPIGVSNDPQGLNGNWQHNVAYWLKRGNI